MDPDDVARLVEELKISSDAKTLKERVSSDGRVSPSTTLQKMLVGKIFSTRVVNRDTLRIQIPRIMQLRREVEIEIVGDNVFLIIFTSEDDRRHVMMDGPWNYFNSHMVFKEPACLQNHCDIRFEDISIWVQVHNLPFICMNPTTIQRIGAQRCIKLEDMALGEERLVILRYEKLPDFCYACGRVGHVLRYCVDIPKDKRQIVYGMWLRAGIVVETRRP
ncbi:hypothetical protein C2S52_021297 [Perilla frutescens var. hirtella]|nr:hypothetical protein C2S52_021297 [Perilla frutescens var. hirtella]